MKIIIRYYENEWDAESTIRSESFSLEEAIAEIGRIERAIKSSDEKKALTESDSSF